MAEKAQDVLLADEARIRRANGGEPGAAAKPRCPIPRSSAA